MSTPRALKTAWSLRTTVGELVERSKNALPAVRPDSRPFFSSSATASTSLGSGSEANTTSAASATARGESAQRAPAFTMGLGGLAADVVDDQLVAGLHEVGRHVAAHGAEADEPDLHDFAPSKTLRAMRPAVIAVGHPA